MGQDTSDRMLLTIVLKHHAGLTLDDVQSRLKASDWWERFPVEGTRVVSWTVAMGLGQIVTLELPPHLLGAVNLALWILAVALFAARARRSRLRRTAVAG